MKNSVFRSGDSLASVSSLTTSGSCKPDDVNSARMRGIVAENNRVCLLEPMAARTCWICSANPISKSLSASSKVTNITDFKLKSLTSTKMCARRPEQNSPVSPHFLLGFQYERLLPTLANSSKVVDLVQQALHNKIPTSLSLTLTKTKNIVDNFKDC